MFLEIDLKLTPSACRSPGNTTNINLLIVIVPGINILNTFTPTPALGACPIAIKPESWSLSIRHRICPEAPNKYVNLLRINPDWQKKSARVNSNELALSNHFLNEY